ncbi:uncharacterized protein LOC131221178 isoform X2 [Magnolia sinica]|uniref:uncharacterized protein LOC131221178 isoform X2 n=1 Tax=Magnolia sinica TaxID=86752 RepID=UPI002657CCB5|nr:uncharacterized protein LOC131221178 isoform X2 [Magnolia sinica]
MGCLTLSYGLKTNTNDESNLCQRKRINSSELLQFRELYGKVLILSKRKSNFQQEYQKLQASQPVAWKYQGTDCHADGALEQFHADIQTPHGQKGTNILLTGSVTGSLSLYEVVEVGEHFDQGVTCIPNRVWPLITEREGECGSASGEIRSSTEASTSLPSSISCIKRIGKHSPDTAGDGSSLQHALVTTLGSGMSGGSVYTVNLNEPLDFCLSIPINRRIFKIASLNCTIWTADCNSDGKRAVLGTNHGAALIDLESGLQSWVCRSKSDIFSQQFDQSGNIVLCGFRNGAIVEIDVRQRQRSMAQSTGLPRHRIAFASNKIREPQSRHGQSLTKQYFELKGNLKPSNAINMSSAVCSLVLLQSDDKYFLASSMDGFIKLYDRRLIDRGAVQSYKGHMNTHTHLQLGVDPSESLVMSGGEDCCVRIWSIKTGELLFGTSISDTVVSTVCWAQTGELQEYSDERHRYKGILFEQNHSWGAWLGSREGLFYMHAS